MSGVALASGLRVTAARPEGVWLPTRGRSMGRAVPSGGEVHVVAAEAPAVGEVWAFCTPGGEVLAHRCRVVGPPHRFRGDARPADDEPVETALLIGRVDRIRTGDGEIPVSAAAVRDRLVALRGRTRRITRTVRRRTPGRKGR